MTLRVDVRARRGAFALDVRFEAGSGITVLFGRSGAGKTSVVDMVAGLLRPEDGSIAVDGRRLFDRAARIDLPAHARRIGYVFQEGRLFPHLTVRQNLLYGAWFAPREAASPGFDQAVALLGLAPLLHRRPAGLSGGEKQRVAIGRALLAKPRILLMDEPLAALDEARKAEILPYIERLRDELRLPILYVSHSIPEVTRLADTLVLLSDGKVAAAGPLPDVMGRLDLHPLTGRYEAGAVIEAEVAGIDAAYGLAALDFDRGRLLVPAAGLALGARVRVRIRARDVALALGRPAAISVLNAIDGVVAELRREPGPFAEIRVAAGRAGLLARITRKSLDELRLAPGTKVVALIKAVAVDRHSLGLGG
jgi:molybdate transport system ATP-binding protein